VTIISGTTITEDLFTARHVGLGELHTLLQRQHAARHDVVVPADRLRLQGGNLIVPLPDDEPLITEAGCTCELSLHPTHSADGDIAAKLDIPVRYYRRMRASAPWLLDANVNQWLAEQECRYLVRAMTDGRGGGIVRALLSDTYGIINNLDVLMAMLDGLQQATSESGHDDAGGDAGGGDGGGDGAAGVEITSCDLTPNRMYVAVQSNTVTAMAPQLLANYVSPFTGARGADNPVVFGGFILANSETGKGRYTITPRLTVQVCDNGLQLEKHAIGRRHVGARMDEGQIRWSADTEQTNLALIGKQTRDAVRAFLDPHWVAQRLAELERDAGVALPNPQETIEHVSKQLRFTDEQQNLILSHFISGADVTSGGVMQAVTSAAQLVRDADDAYAMESAGVEAMRLAAAHAGR